MYDTQQNNWGEGHVGMVSILGIFYVWPPHSGKGGFVVVVVVVLVLDCNRAN